MNSGIINSNRGIFFNSEGVKSYLEKPRALFDTYCCLGGRRASLLPADKVSEGRLAYLTEKKQKLCETLLKIASYCSNILSKIICYVKCVCRKIDLFHPTEKLEVSEVKHSPFLFEHSKNITNEVEKTEWFNKETVGATSDIACLTLKGGRKVCWKETRDNTQDRLASDREIVGSRLSHYFTNGFVPMACKGTYCEKEGLFFPWVKMNTAPFRHELLVDQQTGWIDFSFLTEIQKHQLLVHILTDRLISNWDTHTHQYAFDEAGNLLSFDKEMAFEGFFLMDDYNNEIPEKPFTRTKPEPKTSLALDESHWRFTAEEMRGFKNPLYLLNVEFIRQVMEGKLVIDLNHQILRSFFEKCRSFKKEDLRDFSKIFAERAYQEKAEEFYEIIFQRIRSMESSCCHYFKTCL